MSCKAVATTHNINNTFGPGIANERTAQWWFKKVCKGDESSEDECSGRPQELTVTNGERPSELILLQLHEAAKNSTSTVYSRSAFEANWKGEKTQ